MAFHVDLRRILGGAIVPSCASLRTGNRGPI
jgi:hypothetical protein